MSGDRRLKLILFFALILICTIFVIANVASADEDGEVEYDSTYLLDQANSYQDPNGSWDDDINYTVKLTAANSWAYTEVGLSDNVKIYSIEVVNTGKNWTMENYDRGVSVETQSIIFMTYDSTGNIPKVHGYADFQFKVGDDIAYNQRSDGSWNSDVGDTAMATYALNTRGEGDREVVDRGCLWLLEMENEDEFTWGTVEDDSKSILALESAGVDVSKEVSALALKQRPDGNFGGIEDTAWATMALSINPNKEAAEKAMTWLRSREYENLNNLAVAAMAEQFYENSILKESEEGGGYIPPPWMYALSILVISSFVLSYWFFARLDRNEILEGVRKDIYTYIVTNPGEHLANIAKTLDLSSGSARYHLSVLEGMEKIVSYKNGKYKRYYVNKNGYSRYTNGNGYKHIMSVLKNNTARKIVKFLITNPESNQKSVSRALKIYPSTVNWHVKRLKDAEIIDKHRKGKEIVYSLNQDVQLKKVIGIIEGSFA